MSLSVESPATRPAMLLRRRIAAYFVGGVDAVPTLVGALAQRGHLVHELSVDIRDGVRESSMVCTILLPSDETEHLLAHLRELPAVVSAELV
ncbi:hypothetical protein HFP15_04870 [Amycolatopsis sp. K13G38]|uniref:ACT domain-containing protein n=1 Tax=Amycolatopsis acididurans TaxID=2724524 RepID=A0ABX1IXH8_9PSEU|nr:hypothetical protein [Amycolatopsis acididurans]NKQ52208.1 hypothetical protein [Amycolatopsis acididurans]